MGRPKKTTTPSKMCVRCDTVKTLAHFYPNGGWKAQSFKDAWCKDCAAKYGQGKEGIKTYCMHNNRLFSERAYEVAVEKAKLNLSSNEEYIAENTTQRRKTEMEERATTSQYFSLMNLRAFYTYIDNMDNPESFVPQVTGARFTENDLSDEDRRIIYSKEWCGWFEAWQIERLNTLYSRYEQDFNLGDVNLEDSARKACKASLNADIAEDKYRRGEISMREYTDAQKVFDTYSLSSNFAASKRKPGEGSTLGSLGELIYKIEVMGELSKRKITFEPDDIDRIIADFRHTDVAIGEDTV